MCFVNGVLCVFICHQGLACSHICVRCLICFIVAFVLSRACGLSWELRVLSPAAMLVSFAL